MYYLIIFALLAVAGFLVRSGIVRERRGLLRGGVAVLIAIPLLLILLSFWGEWLWFEALEYENRFWTALLAGLGTALAGGLVAGGAVWLVTPRTSSGSASGIRPAAFGALLGAVWGLAQWPDALKWWYRVDTGTVDPILQYDVSFYLFTLPFFDALYWLAPGIATIGLVSAFRSGWIPEQLRRQLARRVAAQQTGAVTEEQLPTATSMTEQEQRRQVRYATLSFGLLLLVFAAGQCLNGFHILFSEYGVVTGAGWTDVHVRLPGFYLTAGAAALCGAWLIGGALRTAWQARSGAADSDADDGTAIAEPKRFLWPLGSVLAVWLLSVGIAPTLTQWLWVSPNEITVERPYIEHNIAFTRAAFGLDDIEQREFSVSEDLTQETIDNNRHLISEVRLWDPRALLETYEQFQEIRLYYEFSDVDIDRYTIDGQYRQVMISPREMEVNNLPQSSQTFVNRRFKYTHGYGLTLAPVSDFTRQGLPNLLVKDLPPQTESPELSVDQPEIYYGEHTTGPVVVNSEEPEFDYPSGEKNVYDRYSGSGGVQLSSLWRKFLFGWKFDGTRFFFSGYPTPDSRVQFHREVRERVQVLAPFLEFDDDPYVVLQDGALYWIIDAYTTSSRYPYSDRLDRADPAPGLQRSNYVRNSVKAVVDAYEGTVDFHVFEPDDPIIQVWDRIYPGLLQPADNMPQGLREHVRYPEGLLAAQGAMYTRYHMTDPEVFYNQEDLWVRATEKYYSGVQPVAPYYVMWEPPSSDEAEFILMQPFTPKNRQVMIGWIAGMCDGDNYGRLLAYRFPKEKRVLGPQQVETKIDQDRYLSGQLTLWDQRGSRVIRGNLLAIPVNNTLLYVEPIYLQAEAAAYPELRLVAVMHNDRLSYAQSFEEALRGLVDDSAAVGPDMTQISPQNSDALVRQANQAFQAYMRLTGEQKLEEAAAELERLRKTLNQLTRNSDQQSPDPALDQTNASSGRADSAGGL